MYVLGDDTTKVTSGTAAVLGGAAVLPNTGGSTLLTILSVTTLVIGAAIVISFVATRVLARRYTK